jgi:hypothetical protein
MRRIYDSDAISRDDNEPFQPSERDESATPAASRTLPAKILSQVLVPDWLRFRGLSVSVATPQPVYETGDVIPIRISIKNALPFPISVTAGSSLLWTWAVDGVESASHTDRVGGDEPRLFTFNRSETKQFHRRWHQMFQLTESQWEPAEVGEHTITAALNVPAPADRGVRDATTVQIQ